MKNLFLLLTTIVTLASCNKPDQTVTINNQYRLTLPGFLSEKPDILPEASLSYCNEFKEFYTIVIDEPISDIAPYYDADADIFEEYVLLLDGMRSEVSSEVTEKVSTDFSIGSHRAQNSEQVVMIDDMSIYYNTTIVMTNDKFYQIVSWCLSEDEEKYQPTMEKIGKSFIEL